MKLRIQFHKLGPVRFTSHKDTMRMFQRCFAAAGIPVSYSEGFHPHMRMSFAPPLKTGWEGYEEYLDLEVDGPPGEIRDTCNARLPEGLRINHVYVLSDRARKIAADVSAVTLSARIHPEDGEGCEAAEAECAVRERFLAGASNGADTPRVMSASIGGDGAGVEVRYTTTSVSGKTVGPVEVVAVAVGDPEGFAVPLRVARLAQFVERDGDLVSPISKGVLLNRS
jgi:radical SAM-linked protein